MTIAAPLQEEILTYFLWLVPTLATMAAVGLYTLYKTGADQEPYEGGREKNRPKDTWYSRLHKPAIAPGNFAVALYLVVGSILFSYALWRFWLLDDTVRFGTYGLVILYFALAHWFMLGVTAYVFLGLQSVAAGAVSQFLNLGVVTVIMALMWVLHVNGSAVILGPGICISAHAALHLVSFVIHVALYYRNPRDPSY